MLVDYWGPSGDAYQVQIATQVGELCTLLSSQGGGLFDTPEYEEKRHRIRGLLDDMRTTVNDLLAPDGEQIAVRLDRVEAMVEEIRAGQ